MTHNDIVHRVEHSAHALLEKIHAEREGSSKSSTTRKKITAKKRKVAES